MKARRWAANLGFLLLGLVLLWQLVLHSPLGRRADVAAGYSARVICACHFVAGRSLQSCLTDMEPGTELARVTIDDSAGRVTSVVPLLARRSASVRGDLGCTIDP
ncbi:hypothetical protein [Sandaracinobacteroides saxicola]|uniref:Uncharacterized protein n=1 Tax=Sandaracinobacteroides saxicola TaxID=2759707 RepID=A0A7G5IJB5_9SPHN|nr:hypothetical protein [Sandaracinobacteroides saxicola]QMW23457.1 hypothetical protein H3309_02840 [Sandaracinobacteroides saxicola]